MEKTLAEIQKAKAEAAKLRRDDEWKVRLLSYLAPFLTAAAAAIGVWVSVRKAGRDRRDAIEREVRDRREARRSAEIERFDERFAKAVEGLSSAKAGEESGAAVLVASMVRDKSEALSNQALQLLLVSLQTPHDEACERLLRYALERFARSELYPDVVDDPENEGGVPSRLIKTDRRKAGKEGTPWEMFAGSTEIAPRRRRSRWMTSPGRARSG